jgi:hypothetical protein
MGVNAWQAGTPNGYEPSNVRRGINKRLPRADQIGYNGLENTSEERRNAALVMCGIAPGSQEAHQVLDALGLLPVVSAT